VHIRFADLRDLPALRHLYQDTVRAIGPQAYSEDQVTAWAAFAEADTFPLFISTSTTFVAEDASGILGFCGVSEDGHLASLYVRHDCCRQGVGSRLLARALQHADDLGISQLHTEASHFSRPFFQQHGFADAGTETVKRAGVDFTRFLMTYSMPAAL
jgi:putative acetyltransferase